MEPDCCYRIINHKVAHEIIDGEVVVIQFDTGNYYSLTGISSQIWQWFASQPTRGQILRAFEPLSPDQIQGLDEFMESLVNEGILEKDAADAGHEAPPLPERLTPFEQPTFAKYNDMQNLLLSDPIHDVDETGWPNLPPDRD